MIDPRDEEQLQASLDGALSPEDDRQLRQRVEDDAEVRARAAELRGLGELLAEAGDVEPPASVREGIRAGIAPRVVSINKGRKVQGTMGGGQMKKVMVGIAAAAAVILVVLAITGFPPVDDAQGTIGAAKRYNGGQMTDADVTLGDTSAQTFLQSDTFAQLVKDPDAVKLLSNQDLGKALGDPALARLLGEQAALARLFGEKGFTDAMLDAEFRESLARGDLGKALADQRFREALARGSFGQAELARNLNAFDANLRALGLKLELAGLSRLMGDPAIARAFSDSAMLTALQRQGFVDALLSGSLGRALHSAAFKQALQDQGFNSALKSGALNRALELRLGGDFGRSRLGGELQR